MILKHEKMKQMLHLLWYMLWHTPKLLDGLNCEFEGEK
jgi:hypothetical protein